VGRRPYQGFNCAGYVWWGKGHADLQLEESKGNKMTNANFLDKTENRDAARIISQRVLAEVEPKELEISAGLIDPLLDMSAQGKVITTDTSDQPGGFGGADLMVLVVVPIVVTVLGNLLTELGKIGVEELKEIKQRKDAEDLILVASSDIESIISRTQSTRGAGKSKELTQALNKTLLEYLEVD
jgi:hypothetical protein